MKPLPQHTPSAQNPGDIAITATLPAGLGQAGQRHTIFLPAIPRVGEYLSDDEVVYEIIQIRYKPFGHVNQPKVEILLRVLTPTKPVSAPRRSLKVVRGYTNRNWSEIEAGDWWVGDDLTPPVYFWDEKHENPQPIRGQLLMLCDAKTDFILGWVLLSTKNYNSRAIRSLITRCHDGHGLPRKGFHFEGGIWKQSRILTGKKDDADLIPIEDTEIGLSEFNCKFVHATTPGQKTIERVFGLLQDRMENLPGYCGRDERRDCPEKTRRQIMDVQAGRAHPADFFLEKQALNEEFARIFGEHNAEPRGSRARRIPGQSPAEVYDARRTEDLIHLGESARYLLATHRIATKVTRNGIALRPSLGAGLYSNEHTSALIGQTVLAWIDVDAPEAITITTLDRREPRLVERAHEPKALGAEAWEKRDAVQSRRSHASYGDGLYRVVTGGRGRKFRTPILDRAAKQLGEEMQRQKDTASAVRRESANLSQKFDRLNHATGHTIPKPAAPRLRAVVEGMQATAQDWDKIERNAQEDIHL